jgi:hypothetical protein
MEMGSTMAVKTKTDTNLHPAWELAFAHKKYLPTQQAGDFKIYLSL